MSALLKTRVEQTLGQAIPLTEFNAFLDLLYSKSFDKKSVLAEEGKVCKNIYFFQKGSAYSYILDTKAEKHAIQFALAGYWISDLYSFFSGRPGKYNIETLEPSEVLVLNKQQFEAACDTIPVFNRFFRILIQNAYVSLQFRLARTNSEDAEFRYREFSSLHPDFVQNIPQYLIASYLGVKPQSLSRIRKALLKSSAK
ncbi:MAG TPA: Crp/Fnr family transcriptional regulator [Saprospiraceae bacterium]|nr:Crp/Fnr family transcriptional regulator [Saprospiraceae bacterium]HNT20814.1 Crp/Fnr family transcriptional regulator [Saprospiraceae bacterium]